MNFQLVAVLGEQAGPVISTIMKLISVPADQPNTSFAKFIGGDRFSR